MKITHVAIIYDNITYGLPAPNRHHDVIRQIGGIYGPHEEGFILEDGSFVNREQAYQIAKESGQLKRIISPTNYNGPELYSEDLW